MKKLLIAILLFAGSFGYAHAQTIQKTSKKKATTTASVTKAKGTKVEKSATATKHMKADGTPDKRYKENKMTAKATTGPKKKDGTPDMRYKANKKK
ncbi:MAG: hypothetical protein ACTHNG_15060 [Ginsengibacter sp.]|jgi:hypothetical protein